MKNALQILEEAWALLQQPDGWTRGSFAANKAGTPTTIQDPTATCFCSLGAVGRVAGTDGEFLERNKPHRYSQEAAAHEAYTILTQAAREVRNTSSIIAINDGASSLKSIAPLWERAIELAKERA